jgi:hypothetical protein
MLKVVKRIELLTPQRAVGVLHYMKSPLIDWERYTAPKSMEYMYRGAAYKYEGTSVSRNWPPYLIPYPRHWKPHTTSLGTI